MGKGRALWTLCDVSALYEAPLQSNAVQAMTGFSLSTCELCHSINL